MFSDYDITEPFSLAYTFKLSAIAMLFFFGVVVGGFMFG